MIGIIPAAGRAKRLPLPYPKELAPVSYKQDRVITVIESNLQQLANAGITQAVIVIRKHKEILRDYLGFTAYGVQLEYVYQERMQSVEGLTDAVMSAYPVACEHDTCVMLMADVYFTDTDVVKHLVAGIGKFPEAIAAVSVWPTLEPYRFGIVGIDTGYVTSVVDKPEGLNKAFHWGAVAFRPGFWSYMDEEQKTFSQALNRAVSKKVVYFIPGGRYLDLGTPKSLIEGIVEINT